MIHLVQGRRKLFSFPKKWANSIVRWIAGIHSPSGTVKINNTLNPGDASLALDVNMDAVTHEVLERFEVRPVTAEERNRLKHLLRGIIDGSSILMGDGHLFVSAEWLEDILNQSIDKAVSGYVTLATAQKILGYKTFQNDVAVEPDEDGNAHSISVRNASAWSSSTARTAIYGGQLSIETSGTPQIWLRGISNGSAVNLARIYRTASGLVLCAYDANGNALANGVLLAVAPTDVTNTNSLAIATLGWVNDKFIRKIASGEGVMYSQSGVVSLKAIGTGSGTVAAGDHDHDGRYALANHTHEGGGSSGGSIDLSNVGNGVLQNTSGTLSANAKLTALAVLLASSGKIPLTALSDATNGKLPLSKIVADIPGHENICFVTVLADGTMGHSGNNVVRALDALTEDFYDAENEELLLPPSFPDGVSAANRKNVILGTDEDGNLKNVVALRTASMNQDKMLVTRADGLTVAWVDMRADNPGNNVTILAPSAMDSATVDSTTWTAGTTGAVERVHTRTVWNGVSLIGFYREKTYDKYGRLRSISGEVSYIIDTPATVTWS